MMRNACNFAELEGSNSHDKRLARTRKSKVDQINLNQVCALLDKDELYSGVARS